MSDLDEKKVESRSNLVNAGSTIVIVALFAIAALVLLSAGMQVYQKVMLASNENFELRTSLSYVATKIRQYDASGMIDVKNIDGTDVLVLSEEYDGEMYDTMIYFMDGALCELMQAKEFEPELDFGFQTLEIDSFDIARNGNKITLTAGNASGDVESLTIRLRSR